jgi:hypothetical protein
MLKTSRLVNVINFIRDRVGVFYQGATRIGLIFSRWLDSLLASQGWSLTARPVPGRQGGFIACVRDHGRVFSINHVTTDSNRPVFFHHEQSFL